MAFTLDSTDQAFEAWLDQAPSEDELREAYLRLEAHRAALWTAGHIDSFRRDRFERDSTAVKRLVRIKWALADRWTTSGQFDRLVTDQTHLV